MCRPCATTLVPFDCSSLRNLHLRLRLPFCFVLALPRDSWLEMGVHSLLIGFLSRFSSRLALVSSLYALSFSVVRAFASREYVRLLRFVGPLFFLRARVW